ncbi:MAG TPA: type II 3-dehydroquinate dehydratase [Flavipsychrobacter sp.]|nr:type II 3-dehydroquinate dehydratase [Flavipsychrobacter sp.]
MKTIAIVNGPNLNLIGRREPEIYGDIALTDYLNGLQVKYPDIQLDFFQSNIEGELISYLHGCIGNASGIVLNAGGYTHTSIALADTVAAINIPTVEVHISNVLAREDFRKTSFIAAKCIGSISGLGLKGYDLAISYLITL